LIESDPQLMMSKEPPACTVEAMVVVWPPPTRKIPAPPVLRPARKATEPPVLITGSPKAT
jgi:hypothetical protein